MKARPIIFAFICLCLLAGCVTRNASPAAPASNPVPAAAASTNTVALEIPKNDPRYRYDAEVVNAINQRWNDLLSKSAFRTDRTGKVVIEFRLRSNGSVGNFKIVENSAGILLGYVCKKAITDVAPFKSWPPEMVKGIGADYREITFTFYYR